MLYHPVAQHDDEDDVPTTHVQSANTLLHVSKQLVRSRARQLFVWFVVFIVVLMTAIYQSSDDAEHIVIGEHAINQLNQQLNDVSIDQVFMEYENEFTKYTNGQSDDRSINQTNNQTISHLHGDMYDQLIEWSDIDDWHLPVSMKAKYRQSWLNRHVPLEWLHSIKQSINQNHPIPAPPTRYLPLSKLAHFFAQYTAFHARQMKNLSSETRFLIHTPVDYVSAGMGNRFMSLISGFLYAALTNRVLVTDWEHSDPIDSFSLYEVLDMPPIDWRWSTIEQHYGALDIQSQQSNLTINENSKRIEVQSDYASLLCGMLGTSKQHATQFLILRSNQYFVPLLFQNVRFRRRIENWGFTSHRLAAPIMRFLLRLAPSLESKVNAFQLANFGQFTVGVQIRTRDGHATSDAISSLAWQCASFIQSTLPSHWNITYYLVSDSPESTLAIGHSQIGERANIVIYDCPYNISKEGIECALVQMYLLSQSDDLVLSKASTFGDVPRAMSMATGMTLTEQMTCARHISQDICFHNWALAHIMPCYNATQMKQQEDLNGFCVGRRNPFG